MNGIYLDYAASTPVDMRVIEVMHAYMKSYVGNASSIHKAGREVKFALSKARDQISSYLSCSPQELIFTSGGTESNNLALFGSSYLKEKGKNHWITTKIEHPAVLRSFQVLESQGFNITYLSPDQTGRISLSQLAEHVTSDTGLVSIMYVNNEVGTIQPVEEIGQFLKEKGIVFHVDAVQALGNFSIKLSELPVDLMTFSAHKIYGPQGVGALYLSKDTMIQPLLFGGKQEKSRRAGTENIAGILGFAKAIELLAEQFDARYRHLTHLRSKMKEQLADQFPVHINEHPVYHVPHILNVSFLGIETETMLLNLDLEGILASGGSACQSGSLEFSHVLKAMNVTPEVLTSAIRFSFGMQTNEKEIETTLKKIETIFFRLRNKL